MKVSQSRRELGHQEAILDQLQNMRESISGVSLDDEAANLIKYQHAFNASARVVRAGDEMLETVLNLKRL
jgi:flagellar hook-associated protein 1 FlgK